MVGKWISCRCYRIFTYQAFDIPRKCWGLLIQNNVPRVCYAQNWFSYAMGRPVVDSDVCSLEELNRF